VGVAIVWALQYFPRETENTSEFQQKIENVSADSNIVESVKNEQIATLETEMEADRLINSYLGRMGQFIEPVMRPLGFDWKMSIAIVAGLPAKEIVVSTMGVLYQTPDDEDTVNLQNKLQGEVYETGKRKGQIVFTTPVALAFLIFILIYFPCIGVVAAIKNEAGSWRWAAFAVIYTTTLAWLAAFIVYNIGNVLM
jgi:ferrous iron transport protein B